MIFYFNFLFYYFLSWWYFEVKVKVKLYSYFKWREGTYLRRVRSDWNGQWVVASSVIFRGSYISSPFSNFTFFFFSFWSKTQNLEGKIFNLRWISMFLPAVCVFSPYSPFVFQCDPWSWCAYVVSHLVPVSEIARLALFRCRLLILFLSGRVVGVNKGVCSRFCYLGCVLAVVANILSMFFSILADSSLSSIHKCLALSCQFSYCTCLDIPFCTEYN